eukprot:m.125234 g.125234  ORF g.125234 m.125234 type:complete len:287 (+) comp9371_c1_seq4:305-1165(+)
MAAPAIHYAAEERVLCYHGPQMYDAKIKETRVGVSASGAKEAQYFVHYANWNKSWDEWVNDSRLMRYNEANLQKQKELAAASKNKNPGSKRKKTDERTIKRKRGEKDDGADGDDDSGLRPDVRIAIPDELKQRLVDDWDQIIHKNKLVKLPRKLTVTTLLNNYLASLKGKGRQEHIAREVVAGLKVYFDECLGAILLYKFERPQYQEIIEEDADTSMCDVYGPEHLMRLFTKLPTLLSHTQIDEKGLAQLTTSLHDVLKYVEKNAGDIFAEDYEVASPSYIKNAPN